MVAGTLQSPASQVNAYEGGTGLDSWGSADNGTLIYYDTTQSRFSKLAIGSTGQILTVDSGIPKWSPAPATGVTYVGLSGGSTGLTVSGTNPITSTGTFTLGGTLAATSGGTGRNSYAVGDLLYASTTNALARLGATTNGYILTLSGGVPQWAPAPTTGVTSITAGTGLTGGTITSIGTVAADFGTIAGKVTQGNDSRLNSTPSGTGAIAVTSGGAWSSLPAGSSGQLLSSAGSGSLPTWVTVGSGLSLVGGSLITTNAGGAGGVGSYRSVTGPYTASITDDYCINCVSGGGFTVTLPSAASNPGRIFVVKNSQPYTVNVAATASQTIDGATIVSLSAQYTSYTFMSDGSNWIII